MHVFASQKATDTALYASITKSIDPFSPYLRPAWRRYFDTN
jgi:hypothetical protein